MLGNHTRRSADAAAIAALAIPELINSVAHIVYIHLFVLDANGADGTTAGGGAATIHGGLQPAGDFGGAPV